jgi:hypothetical protein
MVMDQNHLRCDREARSMNVSTSWAEIATALAVMGIITFLLLV